MPVLMLFEEETKAGLEGFEVGQQTELGAVNVIKLGLFNLMQTALWIMSR